MDIPQVGGKDVSVLLHISSYVIRSEREVTSKPKADRNASLFLDVDLSTLVVINHWFHTIDIFNE